MNARFARRSALLLTFGLTACHLGVGLPGFGVGVGIGSPGAEADLGLDTPAVRVDRHAVQIQVAADCSCEASIESDRTLLTPAGVRAGQTAAMDFDPRSETLTVEEAWAVTPAGERVPVRAEQILTRPSAAATAAPAFVGTQTTTVLFPQLDKGSRTHVRWRLTSKSGERVAFEYRYQPEPSLPIGEATVRIVYPRDLPLRHTARGGMTATVAADGATNVLTARLADWPGLRREPAMVDARDLAPSLLVSTIGTWERIGELFHRAIAPHIVVTPAIQALADRLAAGKQGLDVARAMHRYVCREVRYVAVWVDAGASWVPNDADEVLRRGYGDCKDQFVLLAALLRARGIRAEAALIGWNRSWLQSDVPAFAQFDHCIAWLPEFGVYSNPVNPFANLGALELSLSDKFVVYATEPGTTGRTPAGKAADNTYRVEHDVALADDGTLTGTTTVTVQGRPAAKLRAILAGDASSETLADELLAHAPEGGFGRLESTDPMDLGTPLRCKGTWRAEHAVAMDQEAWLTTPVGTDFSSPDKGRTFTQPGERTTAAVVGAVDIVWRHTIKVPAGRTARLPKGRTLDNALGHYASSYTTAADGSIVVERSLRIDRDVVPPADHPLLRALFGASIEDARAPIVLIGGAK